MWGTFLTVLHQTQTHTTLLARVAAGADPGAWAEFCARYGDLIRGFCRARGLQPADIDDVQQDVLLALNKAMPGFVYDPSRGTFRGYLKTIVLHAIFRRSCQNDRVGTLPDYEEITRTANADISAEVQWEHQWRQYHLRRAMATLESEFNETDAQAFEQYAIMGQTPAEVADNLGITVDSVYQAKSRILKRLAQVIEQQVAEEG